MPDKNLIAAKKKLKDNGIEELPLEGFARYGNLNLKDVVNAIVLLKKKEGPALTTEILNTAVTNGDFESADIAEALVRASERNLSIKYDKFAANRNMPLLAKSLSKLLQNSLYLNLDNLANNNYNDLPEFANKLLALKSKVDDEFIILIDGLSKTKVPVTPYFFDYIEAHYEDKEAVFLGLVYLQQSVYLSNEIQCKIFRDLDASSDHSIEFIKKYFATLISTYTETMTTPAEVKPSTPNSSIQKGLLSSAVVLFPPVVGSTSTDPSDKASSTPAPSKDSVQGSPVKMIFAKN